MLLVDTSVWVEIFRRSTGRAIAETIDLDDIATCLPVVQEVLQGFRDEGAYRIARSALLSLPIVESPLSDALFLEAVKLYRTARREGVTIRSSVDCLIAACALRHDLTVLHKDRDYDSLKRISALRTRALG